MAIKVAIVHDWLTGIGGAERVVDALLQVYPEADLFTSVYDASRLDLFKKVKIKTSFLQHWPLAKRKHQIYPTLRRYAFESFDFSDYDLVISSSSAEAKGIITSTDTCHICYIHTPTRYYWSGYKDYLKDPGFEVLNPLAKLGLKRLVKKMRYWDFAAAQRPDVLVANSQTVQERIQKYYNRKSTIIFPPVDTIRFASNKDSDDGYYLVVSRLIPYKRVDLAVAACSRLGKNLIVVGSGSELKSLQKVASEAVKFVNDANDEEVVGYIQRCRAFLFCGLEDFGITPVEAMAAGKPVIAFNKGGVSETVVNNKTGVLFNEQSISSLTNAIQKFESMQFSHSEIAKYATKFSIEEFQNKILKVVDEQISKKT